MATHYTHEITVYVWNYHKIMGFFPSKHFGHAAVRLRNVPGGQDTYISWWPGGGANKSPADAKKPQKAVVSDAYQEDKVSEISRPTQMNLLRGKDENGRPFTPRSGQRLLHFDDDGNKTTPDQASMSFYGQSADLKIRIPAGGIGGMTFGLDIVAMYRWWNVFRRSPQLTYKLLSNTENCAGVAALALRAGLGDSYAKPPKAHFFLDPNQVGQWAQEIQRVVNQLNTYSSDAKRPARPDTFKPNLATELMTLQEWKTKSGENVSFFAMRTGQVAKIDELLAKYHGIPWTGDGKRSTVDCISAKVQLLKDMMTQVHSYLATKPDGKRQEAVLLLGEQIHAVVTFRFGSPTWHKAVNWANIYA